MMTEGVVGVAQRGEQAPSTGWPASGELIVRALSEPIQLGFVPDD
jgi:hypothetical protein